MRNNSSVTGTRPLRATYANSPEDRVIEEVRTQAVDDAAPDAAPDASPGRDELGVVIDDFMRAAEEGEAEDSYGGQYTPETLRELHSSLSHVKSELGTMRIQAIRRWHVQGMLDELRRAGLAAGRLTAVVEALHALFRYAIQRGLVEDSPVIWLTFPQATERIPAPAAQVRPRRFVPESAEVPTLAQPSIPVETPRPTATPTPTDAMLALGSRVLSWTVRLILTIFVLVAIVLIIQFA
jgi:hypothetical protein